LHLRFNITFISYGYYFQGPLSEVLDTQQLVYDVSGAGNNWAHGHHGYGPQYREQLMEKLRRTAEGCDSLQSFLLLHSLGGGTGSGLGTYILGLLQVRAVFFGTSHNM
jgi:tubulin epsilon